MNIIPIQQKFDSEIPEVCGNADYERSLTELKTIDEIIIKSGMEEEIVRHWRDLAQARKDARYCSRGENPEGLTCREKARIHERAVQALRAAVLRKLERSSLRVFCRDVARAPLLQWFCRINRFAAAKVFSKSALENYEREIPVELIRKLEMLLLPAAASGDEGNGEENSLGLAEPVSARACYLDTTCIKANIHFPVDWVLLRDAVRTLMLAVNLIRRSGIKNRMPAEPGAFIRRINKLSIEMTQCRRRPDGKKKRKTVLRRMKELLKVVRGHARRHYRLLDENWRRTDYSRKQAEQILKRIRRILERLPEAQRQAHERIIGERQVKSAEKILSLYEDDLHVIVRGKADAEVEFGNTLLLTEQEDGLIVDWRLLQDQSPGDPKLLQESLARIDAILGRGKIQLAGTDRGFDSRANRDYLAGETIYNAMCPRKVEALRERLNEPEFCAAQKRRAQTEARVGIVKRCFAGTPMLQKGFAHREQHLGLSVLSHNLWVLARLKIRQEKARREREKRKRVA